MKILEKTGIGLTIIATLSFCFFINTKSQSNVSTNADINNIGASNMIEAQMDSVTIDKTENLSKLKKADLNITNENKQELFDMMLNTIDYYNTISGKLVDATFIGEEDYIEFYVDVQNQNSYESLNNGEELLEKYYLKDNEELLQYDNSLQSYSINSISVEPRKVGDLDGQERVTIEDDGHASYLYRSQPAETSFCNACIQPQELTFGFLSDFSSWEITGHETYLDRDCYVVEGTSQEYYNQKLDTYSFKMLVDAKTGILLNFEGYDANGDVSVWLKVSEISIDDKTDVSKICNIKLEENQSTYENYSLS